MGSLARMVPPVVAVGSTGFLTSINTLTVLYIGVITSMPSSIYNPVAADV